MSYLVDALKKAERERHRHEAASVETLSTTESIRGGRGAARLLRWVVVLLVLCNLALLVYMFRAGPMASGDAIARTNADDAPPPLETTAAGSDGGAAPVPRAPERRVAATPSPVGSRAAARAGVAPAGERSMASLRLSAGGGGDVRYARAPLAVDPGVPYTGGARTEQRSVTSSGTGTALPDVDINGHLYSSVPGRSFILVNGRRYHEGERLAAGPAVESIDVTGATLNFRGRRFHVSGPG